MTSIETAALVALLRIGYRSPSACAEVVETRGSALAVLEQERGAKLAQPGLFDDERMQQLLATATADLARWREQGMRALTVLDCEYPDNLRTVHDRPPLIFVAGALQPGDARSVAVIGARRASREGVTNAHAIARHLIDHRFTVVSGLAAGIDTAAHTAALQAGGRTVAVIGTGLARAYPPQNAAFQRRIASGNAVISQFWPETPPTRRTFPMRNATMSGLVLATVVVEATHKSGARGQVHRALEHGRPVFLIDSLLAQPWARDLANKAGVYVVHEPNEITATIERLIDLDHPLVA